MFEVIPVIDLKGGLVVHARAGAREHYAPITTPLAVGAVPADIVAGLLALAPFKTLYVADLDAIARTGDNQAAIGMILRRWSTLDIWLDGGFARSGDLPSLSRPVRAVIGSESQTDATWLSELGPVGDHVMSLDFRGDSFLGPPAILEHDELWPRRVIVMTLARVGMGEGPDIARLDDVLRRAPSARVYAAGGVRSAADLDRLALRGVAGALVATALHDGRLTAGDLSRLVPP